MSTRLLSLDPGGTTGYSLWAYDAVTPLQPITHGQVPGGVTGFIKWWRDEDLEYLTDEVVSESFVLDGRTRAPDVTPLRVEGALAVLWDGPLAYQRNNFKAYADDLTLKRLGFWFVGQEHARDSARHALAYMKTRKHLPTLKAYWPPRRVDNAQALLPTK